MYGKHSNYKRSSEYKNLSYSTDRYSCSYTSQVCDYSKSRQDTKGAVFVLPVLVLFFFAISLLPIAFEGKRQDSLESEVNFSTTNETQAIEFEYEDLTLQD